MRICPTCQSKTGEINCPHDGTATVVVGGGLDGLVGQVIAQRYRVVKMIGEGGFGAVYKALHTGTNDEVAIKVLRTEQAGNAEVVARFQDEAAITASLKQPHTVRVFDFGQTLTGDLYIAMEFLDGKTLSNVMDHEQPLGYKRIGHIALQVLKSLAEAHSKGLVHRDLKPDNIFLQTVFGEEDFAKVLDFGIAKSLAQGGQSRTATGVIVGTPPYMSPEQARGTGIDQRTDLYALGCILFEALTNRVPFHAETAIDTLIQRITNPPPDPRGMCLTPTPEAFCDVILKAMATQADARFSTAQEMVKALQEALTQPPVAHLVRADDNVDADDRTSAGEYTVIKSGKPAATLTGKAPVADLATVASSPVGLEHGADNQATAALSAVRAERALARQATDQTGRPAAPRPMAPRPSGQGPAAQPGPVASMPRPASSDSMRAAPVQMAEAPSVPDVAAPVNAPKSKTPMLIGIAAAAIVAIVAGVAALSGEKAPAAAVAPAPASPAPEPSPAAQAAPIPTKPEAAAAVNAPAPEPPAPAPAPAPVAAPPSPQPQPAAEAPKEEPAAAEGPAAAKPEPGAAKAEPGAANAQAATGAKSPATARPKPAKAKSTGASKPTILIE